MIFDLILTGYFIETAREESGIENGECWKCPEAEESLVCLRNSKEANVTGVECEEEESYQLMIKRKARTSSCRAL